MRETSAAGGTVTEAEESELRAQGERPEEEPASGDAPEPGEEEAPVDELQDDLEDEAAAGLLELAGEAALEEEPPAAAGAPDADLSSADAPSGEEEGEAGPGPGDRLDDEELLRGVTALVFASPEPIPLRRIVQLLEGPRSGRVRSALTEIARRLDEAGLPLELREIAGGWHFMTAPESYPTVSKLSRTRRAERLSAAGLETLAVIAYRQPVTKAEIEAIRGVQCGAMLRTLVDRGLVRVTGRATQPGSPLQYGTTRAFLDRFGLASLSDLPRDGELLGE